MPSFGKVKLKRVCIISDGIFYISALPLHEFYLLRSYLVAVWGFPNCISLSVFFINPDSVKLNRARLFKRQFSVKLYTAHNRRRFPACGKIIQPDIIKSSRFYIKLPFNITALACLQGVGCLLRTIIRAAVSWCLYDNRLFRMLFRLIFLYIGKIRVLQIQFHWRQWDVTGISFIRINRLYHSARKQNNT